MKPLNSLQAHIQSKVDAAPQSSGPRQHDAFLHDVVVGLGAAEKWLPSRWLYDTRGSELFELITELPEYYPTRTETSILRTAASSIAEFSSPATSLIEYGAGAGVKTQILLDAFTNLTTYVPIDIAADFLDDAARRISDKYTGLTVQPLVADFTSEFAMPANLPTCGRRVGFFPGSTIGNLTDPETIEFLGRMTGHVGNDGSAVVGFDLVKDVDKMLAAYDDSQGVTADFNLNILRRINRELHADFPIESFSHEARWNCDFWAVEMHLVSRRAHEVTVDGKTFEFQAGESIRTETCRKFDLREIASIAYRSGWRLDRFWMDDDRQFAVAGLLALY